MHGRDQAWEIKSSCFLWQGMERTSSERFEWRVYVSYGNFPEQVPASLGFFPPLSSSPCNFTVWTFVPHVPPARCPSDTISLFRFEFCLAGSASSAASLSDSPWGCWFYCPEQIKVPPLSKAYLWLWDTPSSTALNDTGSGTNEQIRQWDCNHLLKRFRISL